MCDCEICERSREFKKHLATIEDAAAKEWFDDMFNQLMEVENDACYFNIVRNNLRHLYPEIYKEVVTAQDLTTDGSTKEIDI